MDEILNFLGKLLDLLGWGGVGVVFSIFGGFLALIKWAYRRGVDLGERGLTECQGKLSEARTMLDARSGELHTCRNDLSHKNSALADLQVEHRALSERFALSGGENAVLIDAAKLAELVDGQIWSRPVSDADQAIRNAVSRIPVLAIGNLKGGVGKTTCAANLGAFLGAIRGANKRVLFLDFDFQSSLTKILRSVSRSRKQDMIAYLYNEEIDPAQRLLAAEGLQRCDDLNNGCEFFGGDLELIKFEDRKSFEWALAGFTEREGQFARGPDLRFVLKRFLLSPIVQDKYDIVIIDLPPRNTMLAYNAFCAATHTLIVSKDDNMSTDSISKFLELLEAQRAMLYPNMEICGVVPTMIAANTLWRERFELAVENANGTWQGRPEQLELLPAINQLQSIARASDRGFAALEDDRVWEVFGSLATSLRLDVRESERVQVAS